MDRIGRRGLSVIRAPRGLYVRHVSTDRRNRKITPQELDKALREKKEKARQRDILAKAAIRDVWASITPGVGAGDDDELDLNSFDPKPYYSNPKAYEKLDFYYRHHMDETIHDQEKKNWKLMTWDQKRFAYWLAYGSFGPREGFPDVYDYYSKPENAKVEEAYVESSIDDSPIRQVQDNDRLSQLIQQVGRDTGKTEAERQASVMDLSSSKEAEGDNGRSGKRVAPMKMVNHIEEVPPDLPFRVPSVLKSTAPTADTMTKKQPTLDPRSFGTLRLQQYQRDRQMNPYGRFIVAVIVVLTLFNFKKDRKVNVTGVVPEYGWEDDDKHMEELAKREQRDEEADDLSERMLFALKKKR